MRAPFILYWEADDGIHTTVTWSTQRFWRDKDNINGLIIERETNTIVREYGDVFRLLCYHTTVRAAEARCV